MICTKTLAGFLLTVLMMGIGTAAFSQSATDVVHLNDGTVLKGQIVEYVADKHVKIQTRDGKTLQYPADQIRRTKVKTSAAIPVKETAFFNNTTLGLMIGPLSNNLGVQPSLQTVNGIQFRKKFQAGIGTGLDMFYGDLYIPVFADLRYYLRDGDFSPFVSATAGYAFQAGGRDRWYFAPEQSQYKGGFMGGIQAGIRKYIWPNLGFTMSAGYRFQHGRSVYEAYLYNVVDQSSTSYVVSEINKMHRIDLRIGILFN